MDTGTFAGVNAEDRADIGPELSEKRQVVRKANELVSDLYRKTSSPRQVLDLLRQDNGIPRPQRLQAGEEAPEVRQTWRNWSTARSTPTCAWDGKVRTAARLMLRTIRPRPEWPPSWGVRMARRVTRNARPWWSLPMAGLRTCWVFAASVYGDYSQYVVNGI